MDLIESFKVECYEHLENAERALMRVSNGTALRIEDIHEIFRDIHTVKGSAGYISHSAILSLAHAFESVLDLVRKSANLRLSPDQIDVFFNALDVLKKLVTDAELTIDGDVSATIKDLASIEQTLSHGARLIPIETPGSEPPYDAFRVCAEQQIIAINAALSRIEIGALTQDNPTVMLLRAAETLAHAASYAGHLTIEQAANQLAKWIVDLGESAYSQKQLTELSVHIVGLMTAIKPSRSSAPDKPPEAVAALALVPNPSESSQSSSKSPSLLAQQNSQASTAQFIRIDRSHLDTFMNLVSELIVTRNSFEHLISQLSSSGDRRENVLKDFRTSYGMLQHISERMQTQAMNMKLIPIDFIFQKFPRLVRDIARRQGKQVELILEGSETRLDRSIIEELMDPILHLVRNAIDHGIETPEARLKGKKILPARILLKAHQEHQSIVIEVTDNGSGLDLDGIKKKAILLDLISAEDAMTATENQIIDFIFRAGFSTSKEISDVSGRGVGLDVVKTNVEKLNGTVTVLTTATQGTTTRITVPLTMSVMNAILVRSQGQTYAIPLNSVGEVLKLQSQKIHRIASGEVFSLRNSLIRLRHLGEILDRPKETSNSDLESLTVVIVTGSQGKIGIGVDSIQRKEEIVVKNLQQEISGSHAIMGASILGDGSAILILDPEGIIRMSSETSTNVLPYFKEVAHG